MATITEYIDGTTGEKHVATVGVTNKEFVTQNTINIANGATLANADIVQVLNIPKGAVVTHISTYVSVAGDPGTSLDATVGDATDPNGWIATVALDATGADHSAPADAFPVLGGKLYTAADTIDLVIALVSTAPTVGTFTVAARYYMVEAVQNA